LEDQVLSVLRDQIANIIAGAVFLFMGLAACSLAVIRRRSGVRLFIWLGIWSAMYGTGLLTRSSAVVAVLPHSFQVSVPYVNTLNAYLTVVVAFFAFLESSLGRFRIFVKTILVVGAGIALVGIGWFLFGGSPYRFLPYNYLVTICGILVLGIAPQGVIGTDAQPSFSWT